MVPLSYQFNIFILLLFCLPNLWAQKESNNWYFGRRAGIYFNAQNITEVLSNGAMVAPSACATISDKEGSLLFYTNGSNIWNKNHSIMMNGVLTGSLGSGIPITVEPNMLLNTIIIPIQEIESLYYVFTIDSNSGLKYSVVDLNGDNGLGEVVSKNNILLPGNNIRKISAVHHSDGKSIWLMTTKTNDDEKTSFYAYKIETSGVITNPIITSNLFYRGLQLGQMKFSPDGSRIACADYRPQSLNDHLTVFNFNSKNGIVSNKRILFTSFTFFEIVSAYGVEFSNDSKFLYATLIRQGMFNSESNNIQLDEVRKNILYQYDLSNLNPNENWTSLHESMSELSACDLQLGNDGKIYRALSVDSNTGTPYLGVINTPNVLGFDAKYIHNSLNLGMKESRIGLPTFIQSYFRTRILTDSMCVGKPDVIKVDTYAEITDAFWDFGDGNTSSEIKPTHTYKTYGNYTVTAKITINGRPIEVTKEIKVFDIPLLLKDAKLEQCDLDTDGISLFNLNNIKDKFGNPEDIDYLFFYESKIYAELNVNQITNPENYVNLLPVQEIFVNAINKRGCSEISSFLISVSSVELGSIKELYSCDTSILESDNPVGEFYIGIKKDEIRNELNLESHLSIQYYSSSVDALTKENEIKKRFIISPSTTLWVRVEDENNSCGGITSFNLVLNTTPKIELDKEYFICRDQPVELKAHLTNDRFEWINLDNEEILSTDQQYTFSEAGRYKHLVYRTENGLECSNSIEFKIIKFDQPIFNSIEIDKVSKNRHLVTVSIQGESAYEYSLNNRDFIEGNNSFSFENLPAGKHKVYVRDIARCEPTVEKEFYILGYPSYFTPNYDGNNDFWSVKGIPQSELESTSIHIYDRFGKLIVKLNKKNNYSWDGTYNGQLVPQNDYWFEAILKNKLIDKGHFTLKR